jgi:hypothetical protein
MMDEIVATQIAPVRATQSVAETFDTMASYQDYPEWICRTS